ncbi:hypothetical protein NYR30_04285 [Gallibacterium salpingitidis]|uniref:hypothetical protein n=1 Tax=Gallibacterium salpingitidis TaxID=505341 RepID=UPI00266F8EB1|nr:hypothetical protein [Gallibacterium salpingitidis]WKT00512.1 hypothetical protein NYR30_04285 [Gallibacterium salpingitidis]
MITRFSNELQKLIDFVVKKRGLTHYPMYKLEEECGFRQGYIGHRKHKPQIPVDIVNAVINFAEKEGYQFDISYLEKFGIYYIHKDK